VRAGELIYSNNGNPAALYNLPSSQTDFIFAVGQGQWGSVPIMAPAVGIVLVIMIAITTCTNTGRYFVAIGLNARASQFSGVNIRHFFALGFVLSGILAALGGMALLAFTNSAVPRGDESMLFDAFVAVYVGASVNPSNRITIWSTAVGAVFMGLLTNAVILMKLGLPARDIMSGMLILLAVAAGRTRRGD
jgi:ribose transport system permease protein